jgi:integrase
MMAHKTRKPAVSFDAALSLEEYDTLVATLDDDSGHILERALIWTLLSVVCNPLELASTLENDFGHDLCDGRRTYYLDVPILPKRFKTDSSSKRRHAISPSLAKLLEELVAYNSAVNAPRLENQPLFCSISFRPGDREEGPSPKRSAITSSQISRIIIKYIKSKRLICANDANPLSITPRRLRRTMAMRLLATGLVSPEYAQAFFGYSKYFCRSIISESIRNGSVHHFPEEQA